MYSVLLRTLATSVNRDKIPTENSSIAQRVKPLLYKVSRLKLVAAEIITSVFLTEQELQKYLFDEALQKYRSFHHKYRRAVGLSLVVWYSSRFIAGGTRSCDRTTQTGTHLIIP
ncbi:MAG: hypothetical protein F6K47_28140 [Symploca sp. SIO2E6]|nr:hypothetical protein [Symploca sp. SIO2E6]